MAEQKLRSIELFAGCGGLALGLHAAGWEGLFAIEKDPMAFETLSKNMLDQHAPYPAFPHWPDWLPQQNLDLVSLLGNQDLRKHLESLKGSITLVAGGPPCQGFSVGGRRDGLDARNNLVYQMLDFVQLVAPDMVLIENVEGILRRFVSKPGVGQRSVADDVIEQLGRMGYSAAHQLVDASHFGVPQGRKRAVIFAFQKNLIKTELCIADLMKVALSDAATAVKQRHGLPMDRPVTVEEALQDLAGQARVVCPDSVKFDSTPYGEATSCYARLMRRGFATGSIPDSHRFSVHGAEIERLYTLAHETQPAGRLSKKFLLENGTKKDKKVLLDPHAAVSTITTHPDEFIHYLQPRNITVREMARLQSFPDDFKFYGRYTINGPRRRFDVARCSQVGNAVPPHMAEGVGLALITVMNALSSAATETKRVSGRRRVNQQAVAA